MTLFFVSPPIVEARCCARTIRDERTIVIHIENAIVVIVSVLAVPDSIMIRVTLRAVPFEESCDKSWWKDG